MLGEDVELIVCSVVLEELDKHKTDPQPRRQRRARAILKMLNEAEEKGKPMRENVSLTCNIDEPNDAFFDRYKLNRSNNDDRLVASALLYQEQLAKTVTIITGDIGPRLRATRCGLRAIVLPEDYLLPVEEDSTNKRVHELEKQLQLAKSNWPELSLAFESGKKLCKLTLSKYIPKTTEEIDSIVAARETLVPPYSGPRRLINNPEGFNDTFLRSVFAASNMFAPSDESIKRFEKQREAYLREFKQVVQRNEAIHEVRSRSISLSIYLTNSGRSPAEDIDIWLHFPDGFVVDKRPIPLIEPPVEPTSPDALNLGLSGVFPHVHTPGIGSRPAPNVSSPQIKKTNSYEVEQHVKQLKHTKKELRVATYHITFDSLESARSFQIEYRVVAANLPDMLTGSLNVIIEVA